MPADQTFETFMASERDRLKKAREEIFDQQEALEQKLNAINAELRAIDAYEAVKSGKAPAASGTTSRSRRASGKRGAKRDAVLEVIKNNPDGMTRGEIIEAMDSKGDKAAETSISNALTALKKANAVGTRDGKYIPA